MSYFLAWALLLDVLSASSVPQIKADINSWLRRSERAAQFLSTLFQHIDTVGGIPGNNATTKSTQGNQIIYLSSHFRYNIDWSILFPSYV